MLQKFLTKIYLTILTTAAAAFIVLIFINVMESPYGFYNKVNCNGLVWTFSFTRGYPLYPDIGTGPLLARLYGPLFPLVYLPATWCKGYLSALFTGSAISASLFFVPVVAVYFAKLRQMRSVKFIYILPLLLFSYICLNYKGLQYTVVRIHADAITLSLGLLAGAFIYFAKGNRKNMFLFFSAFFAVLSVWTKQIMLFSLMGFCLYVLISENEEISVKYLLWLAISVLIVVGLSALFFNLKNMIFEIISVALSHSFDFNLQPTAIAFLAVSALGLVGLLIFLIYFLFCKDKQAAIRSFFADNRWLVFVLIGLCMVPGAYLGRVKIRGDINNYSYILYYLLFGLALACAKIIKLAELSSKKLKIILLSTGCLLLVFCMGVAAPRNVRRFNNIAFSQMDELEETYAMIEENKDSIYFPDFTLLHIYAEGRVYHSVDGICDRRLAGYPIEERYLKEFMPADLTYIGIIPYKRDANFKLLLNQLPSFRNHEAYIMPYWAIYIKEGAGQSDIRLDF